MDIPEDLKKITDVIEVMTTPNIREYKRKMLSYYESLIEQGMSKEEASKKTFEKHQKNVKTGNFE